MKTVLIVLFCTILIGCHNDIYKEYCDNGAVKLKVPLNKKGEFDGEAFFYNCDGLLKYKRVYKDGLLNGESLEYYPSGKVYKIKHYINDTANGFYKEYDEGGDLIYQEKVINDTSVFSQRYDSSGRVIDEYREIDVSLKNTVNINEKNEVKIKIHGAYPENGKVFYFIRINSLDDYNNDKRFESINADSMSTNYELELDKKGDFVFEGEFRVYDSTKNGFVYKYSKPFFVTSH